MWLPDVMTSTPAPRSASAVDTVSPRPPARFSPLAVTKSMPRSSRSPGRIASTARRPGRRAGRSRGRRARLFRVLHGPRLADDGDLDLARVGQLLLDLLDDVAGQPGRGQVVDLLRADEDPDLPAGLDGERAGGGTERFGVGPGARRGRRAAPRPRGPRPCRCRGGDRPSWRLSRPLQAPPR